MLSPDYSSCSSSAARSFGSRQLRLAVIARATWRGLPIPEGSSIACYLDYHNDDYFGLVKEDRMDLFGEQNSKFRKPHKRKVMGNKQHMKKIREKIAREYGENS